MISSSLLIAGNHERILRDCWFSQSDRCNWWYTHSLSEPPMRTNICTCVTKGIMRLTSWLFVMPTWHLRTLLQSGKVQHTIRLFLIRACCRSIWSLVAEEMDGYLETDGMHSLPIWWLLSTQTRWSPVGRRSTRRATPKLGMSSKDVLVFLNNDSAAWIFQEEPCSSLQVAAAI